MLVLNESDMVKTAELDGILEVIGEAIIVYENGNFKMPTRMHEEYDGGTLLLMPCFAEDGFGTKVISLFPGNVQKHIPVLNGLMILNDRINGRSIALLDGSKLTALRTGGLAVLVFIIWPPRKFERLGLLAPWYKDAIRQYLQLV